MLTPRQKQIKDYINKVISDKSIAPTEREIAQRFKISPSTVHEHLSTLERKGHVKKEHGQARTLETINPNKDIGLIRIPLLGTIAAGQPIEAIQEKEFIGVPKNRFSNSANIYALRVVGNSMIDENINDGDVVLVRHQETAENGQKVVALLDNYAVTLKKYYKEHGWIRLQPANKEMEPIIIRNGRDISIQGIVLDIIKTEKDNADKKRIQGLFPVTPEHRQPKGGCELLYKGKVKENDVLENTEAAKLVLVEKHGDSNINKLFIGDNLNILKTLYNNPEIRNRVDLIYIDPPFGTGQDFIGYDQDKSYSDKLINSEFIESLRQRLIFLRELLSDSGSIYLHIDQKIGHYIKIVMDEVFGEKNFRNDITRIKCNPKNFDRKAFGNIKDVIYFYSKSKPNGRDGMYWNDHRLPLQEEQIKKQFLKIDSSGRRYATTPLHAKGETKNGPTGMPWKNLMPPKGRHWRYAPTELTRLDEQGLIEWSGTGNPRKIIYAQENRGRKIQDIWDMRDPGYESALYPTEKNINLLKQIILSSCPENGLVLDCFSGSGTTILAAQTLGRNWIGIDQNEKAIILTKKRLLESATDENIEFSMYQTN